MRTVRGATQIRWDQPAARFRKDIPARPCSGGKLAAASGKPTAKVTTAAAALRVLPLLENS
jgi:hypothetical protein